MPKHDKQPFTSQDPQQKRKRGRPRADIDYGIVFHMVVNGAPRKAIAKHFGVCVDTILVNCREIISEARVIGHQKKLAIQGPRIRAIIEEQRRRYYERIKHY